MPHTTEQVRSRHPFEVLFLAISASTAIGGLASNEVRPGSLQEGVGHTGTIVWYLLLLLGAATAGAGITWRERATGLVLEELGLFIAGLCTLFYAAVAVILIGSNAVYPASVLAGYAVAAIWRANQIRRRLARVSEGHSSDSGE